MRVDLGRFIRMSRAHLQNVPIKVPKTTLKGLQELDSLDVSCSVRVQHALSLPDEGTRLPSGS